MISIKISVFMKRDWGVRGPARFWRRRRNSRWLQWPVREMPSSLPGRDTRSNPNYGWLLTEDAEIQCKSPNFTKICRKDLQIERASGKEQVEQMEEDTASLK